MKRNVSLMLAFILLSAIALLAADASGKWSGSTKAPDGGDLTLTLDLKQDGTALTGTVTGPQGEPLQISEGKVEGDKLSFNVAVGSMNIVHEAVMKGSDEMSLTAKFPKDSGIPDMQVEMKREK